MSARLHEARWFLLLLVFSQALFYANFWRKIDIRSLDFHPFYVPARLWESGKNPYDLNNQCEAQKDLGFPCSPLAHPPLLLPLMSVLSNEDFRLSYWRWSISMLLLLVASAVLLGNVSDWAVAANAALFFQALANVFLGNDMIFVLFAVSLWAWLLLSGRSFLSGMALSLVAVKPHLAIALALPLLIVNRRAFWGFCVGGLTLVIYSFALVGREGFEGIFNLTRLMAAGDGYGVNQWAMCNVTGILVRSGISTVWRWPAYALGIVVVAGIWLKLGVNLKTIGLAVIVVLFTGPHAHTYDLALLVVPFLLVNPLTVLISSLFMLLTYYRDQDFLVAYLLMAYLGVSIALKLKSNSTQNGR